jgi:hypothetical protein
MYIYTHTFFPSHFHLKFSSAAENDHFRSLVDCEFNNF